MHICTSLAHACGSTLSSLVPPILRIPPIKIMCASTNIHFWAWAQMLRKSSPSIGMWTYVGWCISLSIACIQMDTQSYSTTNILARRNDPNSPHVAGYPIHCKWNSSLTTRWWQHQDFIYGGALRVSCLELYLSMDDYATLLKTLSGSGH